MKRPKPETYGLSGQAPLNVDGALSMPLDPAQPLTQQELQEALDVVVVAEATRRRQREYHHALVAWEHGRGGR